MAEETKNPQEPNCDAETNTERSEQQTPGVQGKRKRTNSPLQGCKMEKIRKIVELAKSVRRQNSGRGPTQKKSKILVFYYRRRTTMTKEPEEDENVPEGSSSSS